MLTNQRLYDPDPDTQGTDQGGLKFDLEQVDEGEKKGAPADDAKLKALEARQRQLEQGVEQRLQQLLQAGERKPAGPPVDPAAQKEQLNQKLWEDPSQFVQMADAVAQRRLHEFTEQHAATNFERDKGIAQDLARKLDADVYDKYGSEVEAHVAQHYPVQHHTNPAVWQTALRVVKGDHAKEIYEASMKSQRKPGQGPAEPSNKSQPGSPKKEAALDEDEKIVAQDIFGISDDAYRKGKAFHAEQVKKNDRLGRKMLQSAWAKETYVDTDNIRRPMITFDSDIQRPRPANNG